jgi:hypothetical protein
MSPATFNGFHPTAEALEISIIAPAGDFGKVGMSADVA